MAVAANVGLRLMYDSRNLQEALPANTESSWAQHGHLDVARTLESKSALRSRTILSVDDASKGCDCDDDEDTVCGNAVTKRSKKNKKKEQSTSSSDTEEEKTTQKRKPSKKGRPSKEESRGSTQEKAALRLAKLKKMVSLAGFRFCYKKLFEDDDSDRKRVKVLEKEMENRGLTPPFTFESCKAFKLRKEQEAELAELSRNEIIDLGESQKGRVTRGQRSAALATRRRGGIIFEESEEDEEEIEEREHLKEETQNMFKNLRGIVSDDAESN